MKKLTALALSGLLAFSAPASAQVAIDSDVPLSVVGHPFSTAGTGYPASGSGGGFLADFTVDFPSVTAVFNDYLVWCIDANRQVSNPGGPYSYAFWDAFDYANSNLGAVNGHPLSVSDMKQIVSLVSTLNSNWAGLSEQQRADYQGSIWATYRGEAPVIQGSLDGNIGGWYVLHGNEGNQTFITYLPEPSAGLLSVAGFGLMMVFAMRRRARN